MNTHKFLYIVGTLLLAYSHSAEARITLLTAAIQGTNVLRYQIDVVTTENSTAIITVWEASGAMSSGQSRTDSAYTRTRSLAFNNLKPSTTYNYAARIQPRRGRAYRSAIQSFTTSALPADIPTISISNPYTTSTTDISHLLLNFMRDPGAEESLVIVDSSGNVVWYTVVSELTGNATDTVDGFSYDASSNTIYVLLNYQDIVKITLDGTVSPFVTLAGSYAHHAVEVFGGNVYVVSATEITSGGTNYVEDGYQVYDSSGALLTSWGVTTGGMDPSLDTTSAWAAGSSFWNMLFPTAVDWTHANAIHLRDESGVTKAYLSLRSTDQIIKVDDATGTIDWYLGSNGTGSRHATGDFAMDTTGVDTTWFSGQHDVNFSDTGSMVIFDNQNSSGAISRAVDMTLDETGMTVRNDQVGDFTYYSTAGIFSGLCQAFGAARKTVNSHLIATCGTQGLISEFDSSGNPIWDLQATNATGNPTFIYRAYPIYF